MSLRPGAPARQLLALALAPVCWWAICATAGATPPASPLITEPVSDGSVAHHADVHMEVAGYGDEDGDPHECSEWEIRDQASVLIAWQSQTCAAGVEKVHIHFGDGQFVNAYAGSDSLLPSTDYVLRVRVRDGGGEVSEWAVRRFRTSPAGPPGVDGAFPWVARRQGFVVEPVAGGLSLPVTVAVVPEPRAQPTGPQLYVAELYGTIKVLGADGGLRTYAHGLLNFDPSGQLPGSGVRGIGGIVVDPASGDLFVSLVYEDTASPAIPKPFYPKVIRLHSEDGGRTAASASTVLDMVGETQGQSHQISNLTIGPDGKLYVHNGDGFFTAAARDLSSFRGKILRLNLDGSAPADNPFYSAADGISAEDYVFALGFRNPFGGAWRSANGAHYEVENGPSIDRFARVDPGLDYGWDGGNPSMLTHALYNWDPSTAPVNVAFVQRETHRGSGFPPTMMDHAFVTESGPTWATGPVLHGKRITEFAPDAGGEPAGPPRTLVEYVGTGKATAAGLAAGRDGLYFTDLFKDLDYGAPTDPGAQLLRVRFAGAGRCAAINTQRGGSAAETLNGTFDGDPIFGGAGPDRIVGFDGDDCLNGGDGADVLFGGLGGDTLRGAAGRDQLHGGTGRNRLFGGTGADTIFSRDGARDLVFCGGGRDLVVADGRDRLRRCERVRPSKHKTLDIGS